MFVQNMVQSAPSPMPRTEIPSYGSKGAQVAPQLYTYTWHVNIESLNEILCWDLKFFWFWIHQGKASSYVETKMPPIDIWWAPGRDEATAEKCGLPLHFSHEVESVFEQPIWPSPLLYQPRAPSSHISPE
jgi:hypothetical protein